MKCPAQAALAALLLWVAACNGSGTGSGHGHDHGSHGGHGGHGEHAHDDHDHEGEEGAEQLSVTRFSEKLELFMEYPPLVKGQRAPLLAHFTVLETGEPVRSGKLVVMLTKPGAKPFEVLIGAPKRDGLFLPVLEFGSATTYRAAFRIESPQVTETIDVGALVVHEDEASASISARREEAPHDAIPFLMEQQWKVRLKLAEVRQIPLRERLSAPATVEPAPGGEVAVSVPLPGRLKRAPSGTFITAGKKVEKGEVLALLELAPETASRVRQAKVKRDFARRAFERIAQIRKKGVGSEQQYEQAQQELELAEAEYRSLLGVSESSLGKLPSEADGAAIPIAAPVSGEIVSAEQREGAYVNANEELFRVLDSDTVWVEARVSEFDLAKLREPADAVIRLDAYPEREFPISELGGRLVNVGTRVDPQTRTVAIRYELPNPEGTLRIGMFGTADISTSAPEPRLAIPLSAVLYENGVATAYALLSGETFQKRKLTLGVRGEDFVEVLEGLSAGERLVSEGAFALKLAAASPASFGHGHAH